MTDPRKVEGFRGRSVLDRMFFRLVTAGWKSKDVSGYIDGLRRQNQEVPREIAEAFGQIDAKAAGLLTHVSLMIAGLGLVAPLVADSDWEMSVIIFEIAIYLLIAVGTLRCLSIFSSREFGMEPGSLVALSETELIIRRELYAMCLKGAIVFTIVVFLLLPILFFWKPVHA
jgi:hypothetical protein